VIGLRLPHLSDLTLLRTNYLSLPFVPRVAQPRLECHVFARRSSLVAHRSSLIDNLPICPSAHLPICPSRPFTFRFHRQFTIHRPYLAFLLTRPFCRRAEGYMENMLDLAAYSMYCTVCTVYVHARPIIETEMLYNTVPRVHRYVKQRAREFFAPVAAS
jgi:hypothetical protein